MSERRMRVAFGRTVQVVDYKDSIKYDVALETSALPDESLEDFKARAIAESRQAFADVEVLILGESESTARDRRWQTNEVAPLATQIAQASDEKSERRTPPRRK